MIRAGLVLVFVMAQKNMVPRLRLSCVHQSTQSVDVTIQHISSYFGFRRVLQLNLLRLFRIVCSLCLSL